VILAAFILTHHRPNLHAPPSNSAGADLKRTVCAGAPAPHMPSSTYTPVGAPCNPTPNKIRLFRHSNSFALLLFFLSVLCVSALNTHALADQAPLKNVTRAT
jgi:hypothetical protein